MRIFRVISLSMVAILLLISGGLISCAKQPETTALKWITCCSGAEAEDVALILHAVDRIERASEGKYTAELFHGSSLAEWTEFLDAARTGISDISTIVVGYTPERTGASCVLELPGVANSAMQGTAIAEDLLATGVIDFEWTEVKLLNLIALTPTQLFTIDKKIENMKDFEGLKIRGPSKAVADSVEAFGATPVTMGGGDIYTSLQRGLLDGGIHGMETAVTYGYFDTCRYATTNFGLNSLLCGVVVNLDTWDSLPTDLQVSLDEIFDKYIEELKIWYDKKAILAEIDARDAGLELYELSPEVMADIRLALKPQWEAKEAALNEAGLPGTQIIEALKQCMIKNGVTTP